MTVLTDAHTALFSGSVRGTVELDDPEDAALYAMLARSLNGQDAPYPCLRFHKTTLHCSRKSIFDRMAALPVWQAWVMDPYTVVLKSDDAFGSFKATGDDRSCTVSIRIWAKDAYSADAFESVYKGEVEPHRVTDPQFNLDWRYMGSQGLRRAMTVERVTEELLDEAYPVLMDGVDAFIRGYLDSPASILVLQGPPGTGKTRLVRGILREMSRRKKGEENADVLYSGDQSLWQSDEIFMQYLTGDQDVFLIEDADHLMEPRSDGNLVLHRFLNLSDGIAQIEGRKIIFSTNVPNVGDIDEALVRPGRRFAHVRLRLLTLAEAGTLLERLCGEVGKRVESAMARLERTGKTGWSVAEVYAMNWETEKSGNGSTVIRDMGT